MKVAILGASGYTGVGLFTLCSAHPELEVVAVSAERHAGEKLSDVFPSHDRHGRLHARPRRWGTGSRCGRGILVPAAHCVDGSRPQGAGHGRQSAGPQRGLPHGDDRFI